VIRKWEYLDFIRGYCTREQYYAQYNPIKLELGKTYTQQRGTWSESHYQVIFQDEKVSLCKTVWSAISPNNIGNYDIFYTDTGFRVNDNRIAEYKLEEL